VSSTADLGPCRLIVQGEVDVASVPLLLDEARELLATGPFRLEVDLEAVTFIDSSGLGALVRVRNEAKEQGIAVTLANVSDSTQRLLQLSGLHHVFEIGLDE